MNSPIASLTNEELLVLAAKAKAATKGPWTVRKHPEDPDRYPSFVQAPRTNPSDPYDIEILGEDIALYETREQDVDFIAGAQPAVVLSLIDEVLRLRARQ